jgi:hypothetical protein
VIPLLLSYMLIVLFIHSLTIALSDMLSNKETPIHWTGALIIISCYAY